MNSHHAVVWIDQNEAKIFHVGRDSFDASAIHAPQSHVHRHPGKSPDHPADEQHFYHEVAHALASAGEILVVGPAKAKLGFIKHVHKHDHALEPKIVGVETVDHPTDGQLVAYVRRYFHALDRMEGVVP